MKGTTLKFIVIVIVPIIILIGMGIYFIFQIPQVKYGFQKYITNYAIERSVRQGKISQPNAVQLKGALDRLFTVLIKVEKSQLGKEKIEKEVLKLVESKQFGLSSGIPEDDKVPEAVDFLNELSQKMEKLLENSAAESE